MALFFDAPWFDDRLQARELNRADLAVVAEMDDAELALVFKDQMELSAGQVAAFAELLGVSVAEIAQHAGVSTPVPSGVTSQEHRIVALEQRVASLEADIARLKDS